MPIIKCSHCEKFSPEQIVCEHCGARVAGYTFISRKPVTVERRKQLESVLDVLFADEEEEDG